MTQQALLDTAPWQGLDPTVLASADPVPTMLNQEERQMYYWLARDYLQDAGTIVDLGSYVGGSTACLAAGCEAGGKSSAIHSYDRFEIHNAERKARLLSLGVPDFLDADILPAIQTMLSPWKSRIHLYPGDIRKMGWSRGPIELLIIDAAKHANTGDHIASTYFPHLIPGRSLVVHQDFLNIRQPWIAAQMSLLSAYFEPVILCGQDCMVFRNIAKIPDNVIAHAQIAPMKTAPYLKALRKITETLAPMVGQRPLRRILKSAKAHPNIRSAHQLARAMKQKNS